MRDGPSPAVSDAITLTAVTALFILTVPLGLPAPFTDPRAAVIWPAAGLGLGAFVVFGWRILPAVLVGSFLVFVQRLGVLPAATLCTATLVETVVGGWLVRRLARGQRAFDRPRDLFIFALVVALITPLGTTLAVMGLVAEHQIADAHVNAVWVSWWFCEITADLILAPAFILWAIRPRLPLPRRLRSNRRRVHGAGAIAQTGLMEAIFLIIAASVVSPLMFTGVFGLAKSWLPLLVACFPLLSWAALRFGGRAVSTVLTVNAFVAASSVARSLGPFAPTGAEPVSVELQVFLVITSLTGLAMAAVIDERHRLDAELHQLAVTDPLTGLANYRHLLHVIEREIGRARRGRTSLAVLMLDVDNLKVVNDRDGHAVGSRLLMRLGESLRRSCRVTDLIARHGGDEFAVVLPGCDETAARGQAARLFDTLAADTELPAISVSLGVAVFPRDGETSHELLDRADLELYAMKGRVRKHPLAHPNLTNA